MQARQLGRDGPRVSALGLGCMGMSEFYGPADEAESAATLTRALELGVTLFDTADVYGAGHNEELVGRVLRPHRDRVVIATKGGIVRRPGVYERRIDNSPAYLREALEASLRRLGVERVDLYYIHRNEEGRPVEEAVGALADLVRGGKCGGIGLSEVSVETLRRAHAVHPIAAVQSEYSLWTRGPEDGMLEATRELGAAFVPYSPLGRGFLTGALDTGGLADSDFRKANPRFQGEAMERNRAALQAFTALAAARGASPAQLALAWVLAKGPNIIPIPGTKRRKYLEENVAAAALALTGADLAEIERVLPRGFASGERYPAEGWKGIQASGAPAR